MANLASPSRAMWPHRPVHVLAGLDIVAGMSDAPKTRVREIKESRGMTSADLARETGIDFSQLSKIENGKRSVTKNFAPRLAEGLQVPVNELYASVGSPVPERTNNSLHVGAATLKVAENAPDIATFANLPRDIPIFGTAEAGAEGAFIINSLGGPVGYAPRGPGLAGMQNVFAIFVEGDSMVPWRQPGSVVYVQEGRPPKPGSHVVIEIESGPGLAPRTLIKELVRRTEHKLELRQHNPPCTLMIDRSTVKRILRVLEWEEVMGFV